jgi:hypothetical protein
LHVRKRQEKGERKERKKKKETVPKSFFGDRFFKKSQGLCPWTPPPGHELGPGGGPPAALPGA